MEVSINSGQKQGIIANVQDLLELHDLKGVYSTTEGSTSDQIELKSYAHVEIEIFILFVTDEDEKITYTFHVLHKVDGAKFTLDKEVDFEEAIVILTTYIDCKEIPNFSSWNSKKIGKIAEFIQKRLMKVF